MNQPPLGYIVVSDLHLGPGRRPEAPEFYKREEDFFFDDEFAAFLAELEAERRQNGPAKWRLIINGDLGEFMQIQVWPQPHGRNHWQLTPGVVVRRLEVEELEGLTSGPEKSAWKLGVIAEGHPEFFQALAEFVHAGNDLVIIKGNHDAELCWPEVRRKFVETLVAALRRPGAIPVAFDVPWDVHRYVAQPGLVWSPGGTLQFCEFSYCDGPLYVEHGNQHDPANRFERFEQPVHPLFNGSRGEAFLEFPFGSIFVRYFFNEVEKHFSFADNVKPMADAIREIWTRQRWLAIRILVRKSLRLLKALTFPPVWLRLGRVLKPAYATYVLVAVGFLLWPLLEAFRQQSFELRAVIAAYENWRWLYALVAAAFSFFADFLVGPEHRYLRGAAARKFAELKAAGTIRYFAYGHTHDADVWKLGKEDAWYFNTGTWTTVFSSEERLTRRPQQLVFLRVERDVGSATGWQAQLGYWDACTAPHEKPLTLEEDKLSVKHESRRYLEQARLATPARAADEHVSWAPRAWEMLGVPLKRLWEFLLGIPASMLWAALCLAAHLLRPFWRALKQVLRLRFRGLEQYFLRDLRLLGDWLRVSWKVLWS